jgi:hypothetical protein
MRNIIKTALILGSLTSTVAFADDMKKPADKTAPAAKDAKATDAKAKDATPAKDAKAPAKDAKATDAKAKDAPAAKTK